MQSHRFIKVVKGKRTEPQGAVTMAKGGSEVLLLALTMEERGFMGAGIHLTSGKRCGGLNFSLLIPGRDLGPKYMLIYLCCEPQ